MPSRPRSRPPSFDCAVSLLTPATTAVHTPSPTTSASSSHRTFGGDDLAHPRPQWPDHPGATQTSEVDIALVPTCFPTHGAPRSSPPRHVATPVIASRLRAGLNFFRAVSP